jgi:hypothetical protein
LQSRAWWSSGENKVRVVNKGWRELLIEVTTDKKGWDCGENRRVDKAGPG